MDELEKISPGTVLDKLMGFSAGRGTQAESITEQLRRHPLPYLLIAAGIGWLMISEATEKSQHRSPSRGRGRKASSKAKKA
jgi:hypothetical protein